MEKTEGTAKPQSIENVFESRTEQSVRSAV